MGMNEAIKLMDEVIKWFEVNGYEAPEDVRRALNNAKTNKQEVLND